MIPYLSDVTDVLNGIGIDWYNTLPDGENEPEPPFIGFFATEDKNDYADGQVWIPLMSYDIALATRRRDYDLEKKVEVALDEKGIPWKKSVSEVTDQALIEVDYSIDLIED